MVGHQRQRFVEEILRRGVVEPLGSARGRDPEPGGGQRAIATEPGVVGDDRGIGVRSAGEHPPGFAVQQRPPTGGGPDDECFSRQLVAEPVPARVLDQQAALLGELDVGEHVECTPVQDRRQQLDVQVPDDRSGTHQLAGRPELVAAAGDGSHQRWRQLAGGH